MLILGHHENNKVNSMMPFAWCKRGTSFLEFFGFLPKEKDNLVANGMRDSCENLIIASFWFAQRMILGRLECQFHSCAHVSNLSSVGPPNSTTCKGPDKRCGDDTMFDVLLSLKPSAMQIESSLLFQGAKYVCTLVVLIIILSVRNLKVNNEDNKTGKFWKKKVIW